MAWDLHEGRNVTWGPASPLIPSWLKNPTFHSSKKLLKLWTGGFSPN